MVGLQFSLLFAYSAIAALGAALPTSPYEIFNYTTADELAEYLFTIYNYPSDFPTSDINTEVDIILNYINTKISADCEEEDCLKNNAKYEQLVKDLQDFKSIINKEHNICNIAIADGLFKTINGKIRRLDDEELKSICKRFTELVQIYLMERPANDVKETTSFLIKKKPVLTSNALSKFWDLMKERCPGFKLYTAKSVI